jgi:hypothetical protein
MGSTPEGQDHAAAGAAVMKAWSDLVDLSSNLMPAFPPPLSGLSEVLLPWFQDLNAWRQRSALEDNTWKVERLKSPHGQHPPIPLPVFPCPLIPEWDDRTALVLLPDPFLSPGWVPAVVQWPRTKDMNSGPLRLESNLAGVLMVEAIGPMAWQPPASLQPHLLQAAHLEKAVYLCIPPTHDRES